jgi:hypothetical protein
MDSYIPFLNHPDRVEHYCVGPKVRAMQACACLAHGQFFERVLGTSWYERPCERRSMKLAKSMEFLLIYRFMHSIFNRPYETEHSRHCIPAVFHPSKLSWGLSCRGRSFLSYTEPDNYDRYIQVSSLQKRKARATPLSVGLCLLFLPAARRFCFFFFTSKSLLFGTACIRT